MAPSPPPRPGKNPAERITGTGAEKQKPAAGTGGGAAAGGPQRTLGHGLSPAMEEEEPGGVRAAAVLACQYGAWYPRFRPGGHALPARVLPVPPGFPAFLAADGVHLPAGRCAFRARARSSSAGTSAGRSVPA